MSQDKQLFYCVWYKPKYGETSKYTNSVVVNAISPERAREFCRTLITEEGEDWTEYNIYSILYNKNDKMMKKVFEEQENVAWEDI